MTAFRNVINEMFCRDTSKKIKSTFKSKSMTGKHLTGTVIYGYLWDATANTGSLTGRPPPLCAAPLS